MDIKEFAIFEKLKIGVQSIKPKKITASFIVSEDRNYIWNHNLGWVSNKNGDIILRAMSDIIFNVEDSDAHNWIFSWKGSKIPFKPVSKWGKERGYVLVLKKKEPDKYAELTLNNYEILSVTTEINFRFLKATLY